MVSRQTGITAGDNRQASVSPCEDDHLIGFSIPGRNARGRLVRLGPAVTAILAAHDYPEPLCRLLAEALVLISLICTTLQKDGAQATLQVQSRGGAVDLLVCDYRTGELRGYLKFDGDRMAAERGAALSDIFGEGYLAVTLDPSGGRERYQGIVPLTGNSLCDAVSGYFAESEQIPTLLRVAVAPNTAGGWTAAGMLLQYLPKGEEGGARLFADDRARDDWAHVETLGATTSAGELVDADLPLPGLLWRLFNADDVRVENPVKIARGCRCSPQHIHAVLERFSAEDIADMRNESGRISVNCEFCNRVFPVDL